jgi:hypothetical protein
MTLRSSKYLEYIRSQPCEISGRTNDVVAHHVRIGFFGTGIKPSDYRCVPLHHQLHQELHHIGEKTYWKNWETDPEQVILRLLLVYLAKQGDPGIIPDLERIAEDIASR